MKTIAMLIACLAVGCVTTTDETIEQVDQHADAVYENAFWNGFCTLCETPEGTAFEISADTPEEIEEACWISGAFPMLFSASEPPEYVCSNQFEIFIPGFF